MPSWEDLPDLPAKSSKKTSWEDLPDVPHDLRVPTDPTEAAGHQAMRDQEEARAKTDAAIPPKAPEPEKSLPEKINGALYDYSPVGITANWAKAAYKYTRPDAPEPAKVDEKGQPIPLYNREIPYWLIPPEAAERVRSALASGTYNAAPRIMAAVDTGHVSGPEYEEKRAQEHQRYEKDVEAHPAENFAGNFLAPTPGGAVVKGTGLAAKVANAGFRVGTNAVAGGAMGYFGANPDDPEAQKQAMKQGAVGGAVVSGGVEGARALAKPLWNMAGNAFVRAIGPKAGIADRLADEGIRANQISDVGHEFEKQGLVPALGSKEEAFNRAQAKTEDIASKYGPIEKQFNQDVQSKRGQMFEQNQKALAEKGYTEGSQVGDLVKKGDSSLPPRTYTFSHHEMPTQEGLPRQVAVVASRPASDGSGKMIDVAHTMLEETPKKDAFVSRGTYVGDAHRTNGGAGGDPFDQRRGLATTMYQYAENKLGKPMLPASEDMNARLGMKELGQTDEGAGLWQGTANPMHAPAKDPNQPTPFGDYFNFRKAAEEARPKDISTVAERAKGPAEDFAADVAREHGGLKEALQSKRDAYKSVNFSDKAPLSKELHRKGVLRLRDNIIKQVGEQSGAGAAAKLAENDRQYGIAATARDLSKTAVSREAMHQQFSPLELAAGAALHGPQGALAMQGLRAGLSRINAPMGYGLKNASTFLGAPGKTGIGMANPASRFFLDKMQSGAPKKDVVDIAEGVLKRDAAGQKLALSGGPGAMTGLWGGLDPELARKLEGTPEDDRPQVLREYIDGHMLGAAEEPSVTDKLRSYFAGGSGGAGGAGSK